MYAIAPSSLQTTGHAAMDEEHAAVRRVHAAALEALGRGDGGQIRVALEELYASTREHFEHERRLMEASGYPQRDEHDASHRAFLVNLRALVDRAERDAHAPVIQLWLGSRSDSWWKQHVRNSDVLLARYLAATTAQPA